MIKCTKCDQVITGVHYELGEPGAFSSGSKSFIAVATPCNHIIGAVPMTWEAKLDDGLSKTEEINRRIHALEQNVSQILQLLTRNH